MTNHQYEGKLPQFPESYWLEELDIPAFEPLENDKKVDVVIVGGGITGITAGYLLSKEGVKVAIIDANRLLHGTTAHTTAKITAQHDLIYDEFINHFGKSKARLYYEANMDAYRFIEETIEKNQIDCHFIKQLFIAK